MAIYNNREVSILGPTYMQSLPETVRVGHQDGSQETVAVSQVKFTEDEKKNLVKSYPSRFESVNTVSDDDLKAVRAGVAPSYDPDRKAQADTQKAQEEAAKADQSAQKAAEQNSKTDKASK